MSGQAKLAILGTGNIGRAIAMGLTGAGRLAPSDLVLTRRKSHLLDDLAQRGFRVLDDNRAAVQGADTVIVAVEPQQLDAVLEQIAPDLEPERHLLISVVTGAGMAQIRDRIGKPIHVARAMPNTGIALGRSMTCVATNFDDEDRKKQVVELFDSVGLTMLIDEEQMTPATALCACGIAFFLRAVRAAAQGGIEIGFHPDEALTMAAQTALAAASLALESGAHPERAIDMVTTPRGCTIAGLNEMEHQGFSSAMIKGITTSANKAGSLY